MRNRFETHLSYFQYFSETELPVFISLDLEKFPTEILAFLEDFGFVKLTEDQWDEKKTLFSTAPYARLLQIHEAGPIASRQIESALESDRFGPESIVRNAGYKVYRYKGEGLLVYSSASKIWELGVGSQFGEDQGPVAHKIILGRYLSWALSPLAHVCFWGVPVKEGMVVMDARKSKGELIVLDYKGRRILSKDGARQIKGLFKIFKLDKRLRNKDKLLSQAELMSFLLSNTAYLDDGGIPAPIRQVIQGLVRIVDGRLYPEENFEPRVILDS